MKSPSLNFVKTLTFAFILSISFLFAGLSLASADEKAATSLQERASKRLYPGGRDEEDLKVLSQVPEPAVKVDRHSVQGSVMKSMSGQGSESSQDSESSN